MGTQSYWSAVFSISTWIEFLENGAAVAGFQQGQWSVVQRIKPGDHLLCYVMKASRWAGVVEAVSEPFQDNTRIWSKGLYPGRVTVKPLALLPIDLAVSVAEIRDDLVAFKKLIRPNVWGHLFKNSPYAWIPEDGEIIEKALLAAKSKPVPYSIALGRFSKDEIEDLEKLRKFELENSFQLL